MGGDGSTQAWRYTIHADGRPAGQALTTLKNLSGFLDASIGSLGFAASSTPLDPSSSSQADVPVILSDLHSLFALISKETTNLSLAFAPPKEHWDAVEATAKKLNDLSSKTLYGISLLRQVTADEGITEHVLAKQWRMATITVLERLKELSNACVRIYTALGDHVIKSDQRKQILTNTSLVWKAVERTEALPADERSAFVTALKSTIATFDDALEEVEELSKREAKGKGKAENQDQEEDEEEAESEPDDEDGDGFDFDDFDDNDTPISEEELRRVQAAFQYMKLVKALLRKIATLQDESIPYGRICELGDRIASLQDELASALHPSQDVAEVRQEAKKYQQDVLELFAVIPHASANRDLADDMQKLKVDGDARTASTGKDEESRKWYTACQEHLDKASTALLALCEDGPER